MSLRFICEVPSEISEQCERKIVVISVWTIQESDQCYNKKVVRKTLTLFHQLKSLYQIFLQQFIQIQKKAQSNFPFYKMILQTTENILMTNHLCILSQFRFLMKFNCSVWLIIKSIQMGQGTSLNCSNNFKEKEQEVQTTQSNALHLARALQSQNLHHQPDIKSKKSTSTVLSDIQNKTPLKISKAHLKSQPAYIPQHQNLIKISYTPFQGAQKQGQKWIERGGICLADIIQSRYNTNMHFPQVQVVILIESLVYVLAYLQKGGIKHHDFYPTNIKYCTGIFKLANPQAIQLSAYALTQERRRFSFLSPQLIADIVQDTPQNEIPPQILFKSDIFAIGMIVLEFATLQPSAQCYDEENYELIDPLIKERLAKVSQLYSQTIADCISQMLVYNVDDRIPVQDLAIVVYLNSRHEKIEKKAQQQSMNQNPKGNSVLPPLQKPNSPSLQQQRLSFINTNNLPSHYVMAEGQGQINPNNVVVPVPNYAYSHIGPNNQSLLSPSSLQNKLRVIQKINQKPEFQEDSQGQLSSLPSNLGPLNSDIHEIKTQQPNQKNTMKDSPQRQNQQPPFLQQIPPQFIQQNEIVHSQQMNHPIRQMVVAPGYQIPPQFLPHHLPKNFVQNIAPNPTQGNFVLPVKVPQENKTMVTAVIQNLPQNSFKITSVQTKYEPSTQKNEEQYSYQAYKATSYQNIYSNYNQKQLNIAQKDHGLPYQQSLKEKAQRQSFHNYKTTAPQSNNYQIYKPHDFSTLETDSLKNKSHPRYQNTATNNDYQALSTKKKYQSPSIINKYARPRDQNGETLEQRVDRILQISRSIK